MTIDSQIDSHVKSLKHVSAISAEDKEDYYRKHLWNIVQTQLELHSSTVLNYFSSTGNDTNLAQWAVYHLLKDDFCEYERINRWINEQSEKDELKISFSLFNCPNDIWWYIRSFIHYTADFERLHSTSNYFNLKCDSSPKTLYKKILHLRISRENILLNWKALLGGREFMFALLKNKQIFNLSQIKNMTDNITGFNKNEIIAPNTKHWCMNNLQEIVKYFSVKDVIHLLQSSKWWYNRFIETKLLNYCNCLKTLEWNDFSVIHYNKYPVRLLSSMYLFQAATYVKCWTPAFNGNEGLFFNEHRSKFIYAYNGNAFVFSTKYKKYESYYWPNIKIFKYNYESDEKYELLTELKEIIPKLNLNHYVLYDTYSLCYGLVQNQYNFPFNFNVLSVMFHNCHLNVESVCCYGRSKRCKTIVFWETCNVHTETFYYSANTKTGKYYKNKTIVFVDVQNWENVLNVIECKLITQFIKKIIIEGEFTNMKHKYDDFTTDVLDCLINKDSQLFENLEEIHIFVSFSKNTYYRSKRNNEIIEEIEDPFVTPWVKQNLKQIYKQKFKIFNIGIIMLENKKISYLCDIMKLVTIEQVNLFIQKFNDVLNGRSDSSNNFLNLWNKFVCEHLSFT